MANTLDISVPEKLVQMVSRGHLGKKTGQGFYRYEKGKIKRKKTDDRPVPPDMEDRMVMRILNECVACLHEGIVSDQDLLDAGMVFGTGFAPFRGGPLHYANDRGPDHLAVILNDLAGKYGERFAAHEGWKVLMGPDAGS